MAPLSPPAEPQPVASPVPDPHDALASDAAPELPLPPGERTPRALP
jgi:hypothetical protein